MFLVWPILMSATEDVKSYPSTPPKYQYEWQVNDDYSKNNYGHNEERDGAQTVGSYFVLLPDGRTQKVSYTVDAYGGYKAEVTYEGEAKAYQAPKYLPKQPPKYQAQPSSYKPVAAKKVKETSAASSSGQIYYKPVKEAPPTKVYYKPLPNKPSSKVYYKPIEA